MEKPIVNGETPGFAEPTRGFEGTICGDGALFYNPRARSALLMSNRFAMPFCFWACLAVMAVWSTPGSSSAFASQASGTPLLEPESVPQDAVSAEELGNDVSADPIHPWDNNGFSDTTDVSAPGRARQRLKSPLSPQKLVVKQDLRKTSPDVTLPERIGYVRNLPNPFNAQTRIEFSLTQGGAASLEIYNLLGQVQNRVQWNHLDAGIHSWLWQGVTSEGGSVPSGVYFYRIEVEQASAIGKMVLLK